MSESKSASVVFTNGSLLAKNAQAAAGSAKSAADNAYNMANNAQRTADGKNSIYRGSDPSTVPTAILKVGDLYFSENAAYIWNGSSWEETVSDTTGKDIHAKVEKAMAEKDKAIADMKADIQADVAKINKEIEQTNIKTGNALNFYKEQYYLSTSYTELAGGSWSDEVPVKTAGKYVWSRYVTANIGDPTNHQYSDPVCISGLDGAEGPQGPTGVPGPQGPQGAPSYTHIAYANSGDGKTDFDVSNGTGKTYIGIYCDSNFADSMDPTKYTWTLIKGERGDQGIPGTKGADGQTPYFHIAYANSGDGTVDFDVSNSDGKTYIGQYTDYTQADSTNPASYSWTKIKGDTGQTGATGPQGPQGVDGADVYYSIYEMSPNQQTMYLSDLTPAVSATNLPKIGSHVIAPSGKVYEVTATYPNANPPQYGVGPQLTSIAGPVGPKGDTGSTGFFIGNTPPPNPTVGTVWATNDASGNMVSAKKWDGSNWVSTAFTQDLVAGNISATKIVGGELDVNKITIKNAQNIPIESTVSLGKKLSDIKQDADGISTTVRNLHAGDRNLARGVASSKDWFDFQGFNNFENYCYDLVTYSLDTLKAGDKVTFGITMKNEGVTSGTMLFQQYGDVSLWTRDNFDISSLGTNVTDLVPNGAEKALTYTITITDGMLNGNTSNIIRFRTDNIPAGGKLSFRYAFVKKGTMTTDWTPAPEDVDDSISQVKQTADGISAYVKGSKGSKTLESILSMDPDHSSIAQVVNGQIAAAIGTYSDGSVRIDGKALYINSHTKIDDATIKSAMIDSIEADKITTGTLNADKVNIINLNADKITSGTLNGMTITGSKFIANTQNGNLFDTLWKDYQVVVENTGLNIHGTDSSSNDWEAILTSNGLSLQMANDNNTWTKSIDINNTGPVPYIKLINSGPGAGQYASTYLGSDTISSNDAQFGSWHFSGSKVLAQNGSLYVTNPGGGNFDDNGSVGFQVWGGIGLGSSTIYTPATNLYIQQGNVGPALGQSYSSARKTTLHAQKLISQVANTVSSRLSVKTDITPVSYDRALAAVQGTEMYDYRYTSDDSGQHYVSGIIDDVNPDPQYHMDDMLINKERTARIDANLVGYHHVVIQKLLERVAALEEKEKL